MAEITEQKTAIIACGEGSHSFDHGDIGFAGKAFLEVGWHYWTVARRQVQFVGRAFCQKLFSVLTADLS